MTRTKTVCLKVDLIQTNNKPCHMTDGLWSYGRFGARVTAAIPREWLKSYCEPTRCRIYWYFVYCMKCLL